MSSRYRPPIGLPVAKKEPEKKLEDTNALWRIQEWFKDLGPEKVQRLRLYHSDLLRFNIKVNLISRNTERDADEAHFADCILAAKVILASDLDKRVFDIGSGNGLPGIVLGILDPTREYICVESDGRKCEFLKHVIQLLGLKNVTTMNVRFESLAGHEVKCAVSRGFASI